MRTNKCYHRMLYSRCITVPLVECGWRRIPVIHPRIRLKRGWRFCSPYLNRSHGGLSGGNRAESENKIHFDSYPYETLPSGPNIRLLEVYPKAHPLSQGGRHIVVSLRSSPLDSSTSAYEALSYNWEDPYALSLLGPDIPSVKTNHSSISCVISVDGQYNLPVTPNLFLALHALRFERDSRILWVDALCIDQSSPQEKSSQVPLMAKIYGNATKVIIWLGKEDAWTATSASVIWRWASIHYDAQRKGSYQPEILARLRESNFEQEQVFFEALFRRAWFTRAWTFQELCLAKNAEIRCGSYSIPWEAFQNACMTVIKAGQENFVFEEHKNIKTLVQFYSLCRRIPERLDRTNNKQFQLSHLLQRTMLQQSTDPRDKLYSLLGIANLPNDNAKSYRIDYNESARNVYRRFTKDMILDDGDLSVLSMVQRTQSPTKHLEYQLRAQALRTKLGPLKVPDESFLGLFVPSTNDFEKSKVLRMRDFKRNVKPDLFGEPQLGNSDSVVKGLPSWVPDFTKYDRVEYVATNHNIRSKLPNNLIRTKFPRPLLQWLDDRKTPYELHNQLSSRFKYRSVMYETESPDHLGVRGFKIGTIHRVFEMPFTSDPTVTRSAGLLHFRTGGRRRKLKVQAPGPPSPFNFDFTNRFWPLEDNKLAADEPIITKEYRYKYTSERTNIAVLRTLAADMLPISSRLPEAQKKLYFPLHYDFSFWNNGPDKRPRKFPSIVPSPFRLEFSSLALFCPPVLTFWIWNISIRIYRIWRTRLAFWWRGGESKTPLSEFDTAELRHGRRIQQLYRGLLVWPWDIFEQFWSGDAYYQGFIQFIFLLITVASLERVFRDVWWFDYVADLFAFSFMLGVICMPINWISVRYITRRAQSFAFSPSVPVGWENGLIRVLATVEQTTTLKRDPDGILSLWGVSCEIQNAINRASWNRQFLVTDNGYMGIGPVGMRPGDEVWVLVGGHVPFVLRPSGQKLSTSATESFFLVGESYIHGIMDGEPWVPNSQANLGTKEPVKLVLV